MLNSIIRFSLDNRLTIIIGSLVVVMFGFITLRTMEVDVFPDLNATTVVVMTEANGLAPEEVERVVTFPIETVVNGASGVRRVRSQSITGFSVVWVEFDWGEDVYRARQIVSEKLATLSDDLPTWVGKPTLGAPTSVLGEVVIVGMTSDTTSLQTLHTLAEWNVRPHLLGVGGVANVSIHGGDIKEYQILLDPNKMRLLGVTLDDVLTATDEMNRNSAGGIIYDYGNEYIVRGMVATANEDAIATTVVGRSENDMPILLSDVADVRIGNRSPVIGLASERGKPAVLLTVTKQPNVGTIELTSKLDNALDDIRKTMPADVRLSNDSFRQARFIDNSINNVRDALIEGAVLVVVVLFLFLMNVRTTIISLVSIPVSVLVTIIVMKFFGISLNTMTLGGIAIAVGSLVDDAIVDVENVFKRLKMYFADKSSHVGEEVTDVVYNASCEVRMPIFNSTLIIIVSFAPLFFLDGIEGRMLVPLGVAFIVSLCASTLVALTLTPVLSSFLLTEKSFKKAKVSEPKFVQWLKKIYQRMLVWVLGHKRTVISAVVALFISSIALFFTLGRGFLPPFNEGAFTIIVSTTPGIDLAEADKIAMRAEDLILSVPEVLTCVRKTGRAELDEHSFGVNVSEFEVPFVFDERNKDEILEEMREKLSTIPGVSIEIGQPISHRIDAMLSGSKTAIAIKVFGPELDKLFRLGNQIKAAIVGIPSVVDVNVEQQINRPQLTITPRREVLARYGITLPEFNCMVQSLLGGVVVSQVYDAGKTFDLTLKVDDQYRDKLDVVGDLLIDAGDTKVPLSYVADIVSTSGPNAVSRENVQRKIVVSANALGNDLNGTVELIREAIEQQVALPDDYRIEYGGQFESAEATSRLLFIASLFAIVAIFVLLYNQFKSIIQSAVILINLPLAITGGVFIIVASSGSVSIPSLIGFISLFGIATRNGMLLVARYNDLISEENNIRNAVVHGSLDRLNPILMTALSSALSLIPLALAGDLPGNEIQSPMAQVILGGLITSTFLNMFVIPVVFEYIANRKTQK